jgi:uncharacterized membrane protein HdeD (DUF308 family)
LRVKRIVVLFGLLLFALGIVALVHPSFDYHKRDEIAKFGPITATVEKKESAEVPVAATVALLISGLLLIVVGVKMK